MPQGVERRYGFGQLHFITCSWRDGDGNRLEKSSGKIYWYGAGTEILDESSSSGSLTNEYVFFGGKRIAMRTVSTKEEEYGNADL